MFAAAASMVCWFVRLAWREVVIATSAVHPPLMINAPPLMIAASMMGAMTSQISVARDGRGRNSLSERLTPDQVPLYVTCDALTACHRYAALKRDADLKRRTASQATPIGALGGVRLAARVTVLIGARKSGRFAGC